MSAVHPDLVGAARMPRGVGRRWALPVLRAVFRALGAWHGRGCERVELGPAAVYVVRPSTPGAGSAPALLWIHGGGLIMGDARQDLPMLQAWSDALGAVVVSVQHRLAPEHPFPAPLDDCVAAWRWLVEQPGLDRSRLAVGGASAGGCLAAALCQRIRDEGGPQPALQLLVYPMLEPTPAEPQPGDDRHRLWDRPSNTLGWRSYLGGQDPAAAPPYAVPGRTDELAGLPPAWVGVGTHDLFHDQDVAYAARLREAGVEVTLEVVEGAYHGFDASEEDAPVSRGFRAAQLDALRRALAPGG